MNSNVRTNETCFLKIKLIVKFKLQNNFFLFELYQVYSANEKWVCFASKYYGLCIVNSIFICLFFALIEIYKTFYLNKSVECSKLNLKDVIYYGCLILSFSNDELNLNFCAIVQQATLSLIIIICRSAENGLVFCSTDF